MGTTSSNMGENGQQNPQVFCCARKICPEAAQGTDSYGGGQGSAGAGRGGGQAAGGGQMTGQMGYGGCAPRTTVSFPSAPHCARDEALRRASMRRAQDAARRGPGAWLVSATP
jgi:hypothetical protein